MRFPSAIPAVLCVAFLLAPGLASAQSATPQLLKVQGFLSQNSGGSATPVNGPVSMTFALYNADVGGTLIENVGPLPVDVAGGIYEVDLPFAIGDFGAPSRFLEVSVNGQTLAPRLRLASAPFAYVSQSLNGFASGDFVKKAGDTITGSLQVSGAVVSTSGGFTFPDGTVQTTAATQAALGNTLDQAYNQGGPGAGRTINANGGAVAITGPGGLAVSGPMTAAGGLTLPPGSALQFPDGILGISGRTPLQIAMLRWYDARAQIAYAVGNTPIGVAFDGEYVWVVNQGSANVTQLRANDAGTSTNYPVGPLPYGVAIDGQNVWVTNQNGASVTKLRLSNGNNLGTFPVGTSPQGIAFDGTSIWVANLGSNTVTRLRTSDGAQTGTFAVGSFPSGIACDGSSIWVANEASGTVSKLRASDGAALGTFTVGSIPIAVAFDGTNIWVANQGDSSMTKLRASDGSNLGTFPVESGPRGLAFDGSSIWVSLSSGHVTKLRVTDGASLGTFDVGVSPRGVAFDGANIWVANSSSNTISKL